MGPCKLDGAATQTRLGEPGKDVVAMWVGVLGEDTRVLPYESGDAMIGENAAAALPAR
jgi:hypothetical protein